MLTSVPSLQIFLHTVETVDQTQGKGMLQSSHPEHPVCYDNTLIDALQIWT